MTLQIPRFQQYPIDPDMVILLGMTNAVFSKIKHQLKETSL